MFKKIMIFSCLLFSLLFLCSCKAQATHEKASFFKENESYQIGLKTDTLQTKGSFRIDEKGELHFLHEDTTSPRFGMEEVISEKAVTTYFNGMQFETNPYFGGVGYLYDCLCVIQNSDPTAISKKNGEKTYQFDGENLSFEFVFSEKTLSPRRISGTKNGKAFSINFSQEA